MSLVSKQIPALINGVSQQPATIRLVSQMESQVNAWSTVVDGIRKRPPTEHLALLTTDDTDSAFVHTINRDTSERYIVIVTDGVLTVYDTADGSEKAVTFPAGASYLDIPVGAKAEECFAMVTVADYTFVVNKTVKVAMGALGSDEVSQAAYYYWLNRQQVGAPVDGVQQIQYPPNLAAGTVTGTVQSTADLPATAANGTIYKVAASADTNFAVSYFRRNGGVWEETRAPGIRNRIDELTMPWALVREGDGTFTFAPFSWAPRRVGDEFTNPNPSFVGRTIRDVFFVKNRLGFAVDENAVLSRAGDFGNFYRQTVLDLLDDETIDVAASETKVTQINHAVPLSGELMLFSDQTQFRMNLGNVPTPTSVSLDVTTQYDAVTSVRPVPLGSDVYFVSEDGDWAIVREYFVRDESNTTDAVEVNGHCPKFIPKGVKWLTGSPEHDVLFLLTRAFPNRVYVYQFYWADQSEKAQSAWHYWEFPSGDDVLACTILDDNVYFVVRRINGTFLERMSLQTAATAPGLGFQVYLDRRCTDTGTYLSEVDATEFQLPYILPTVDRTRLRVIKGAGFTGARGALINATGITWVDDSTFRIPGNHAGLCIIGLAYTMRFQFSEQFIRSQQNQAILTGKLQLRTWTLYYTDTGYFKTEVAPYGTAPELEVIIPAKLSEFTGKTIGDAALTLGEPAFHTGTFSFQVYGNSDLATIAIVNDSHLASTFQSAEWEGFYHNRSRIIG